MQRMIDEMPGDEGFPPWWLGWAVAGYFVVGVLYALFVYFDARRAGVRVANIVITSFLLWPAVMPIHFFYLRTDVERWRRLDSQRGSSSPSSDD